MDAHAEAALASAIGTGVDRHRGHVIADLPVASHVTAHLHDCPGELVTQDLALRHHQRARLGGVQVGAADPAILDLDEEIAWAHGRLVHLLDRQGIADPLEHRCFHLSPSLALSCGTTASG